MEGGACARLSNPFCRALRLQSRNHIPKPATSRSSDASKDGDSFFVRHAYFLGGKDPFERLKAALRAEIDEDAWATLYRTESRSFARPKSGRIAVKVINHHGDEAMRVFSVP
jgi:hypothetical protein